MTIEQISKTLDGLAPKEDGNLVRANDWNTLVAQLQAIGVIVGKQQEELQRVDTLETQLAALEDRADALENLIGDGNGTTGTILSRLQNVEDNKLDEEIFNQYKTTLDPLLMQYTITLETDDSSYLLGEVATITARVRLLDGSTVSNRPWLDFLVSWGDIQAVSGFDTRPGAGGRSVSVRTDSNGIARVRIKAENLAYTSTSVDTEMQAFFAADILSQGQTRTMREAIMGAANPQDNSMRLIFAETTHVYDNGSNGIRELTDMYYHGHHSPSNNFWMPSGTWNDHRSTIAVFAKDDSNPETPDSGKGVGSIQINFRDWVGPWIGAYRPDEPLDKGPWITDIPEILEDPRYRPEILIDYIDENTKGLGLLGKHKVLESIGAIVAQGGGPAINPAAEPVVSVVADAVKTQKNMDFVSYGDSGLTGRGLVAIAQTLNHAATTGLVKTQVNSVESQISEIDTRANDLETNYSVLNTRVNESTAQGENLMLSLGSIENKVGNISIVDADSVRSTVSAIRADIASLRSNIKL